MNVDEGPRLKPPVAVASPGGGGGGEQQQDQGGTQPAPPLPDDVFADIFHRLAPRWIAVSRCVCRPWCASIDTLRLLRADLLPLSLHGIFVHFGMHKFPAFFSRPTPPGAPAVSGKLNFLPYANTAPCDWYEQLALINAYDWHKYTITDHCNGLLLIDEYVVNPATRRWDALPPAPPGRVQFTIVSAYPNPVGETPVLETIDNYLVFDPTVSAHYQVLRICALSRMGSMDDLCKEDAECPSSVCTLNVLSSSSGCWEERCFVREGDAAGTVAEVQAIQRSGAVYWRGALYVHRESHFVLRISLSNNKYRVIKPPLGYEANSYPGPYLKRSAKGVYFVSLNNYWLRVWILKESCGQIEWVLKHDRDLAPVLAHHGAHQVHGPWILKGINHNSFCTHFPDGSKEDIVEEKFEWCSDSDDAFDNEDMVQECSSEDNKKVLEQKFELKYNDHMVEECYSNEEDICEIEMLGLHPFKEILFLCEFAKTGLAYHLNSSKVECLGDIYPTNYLLYGGSGQEIDEIDRLKNAFPYTPCWIEEFRINN